MEGFNKVQDEETKYKNKRNKRSYGFKINKYYEGKINYLMHLIVKSAITKVNNQLCYQDYSIILIFFYYYLPYQLSIIIT